MKLSTFAIQKIRAKLFHHRAKLCTIVKFGESQKTCQKREIMLLFVKILSKIVMKKEAKIEQPPAITDFLNRVKLGQQGQAFFVK